MAQTTEQNVFDYDLHLRNRHRWTMEQLAPYRDQWVAWSLDGNTILAHHEDPLEVVHTCKELGLTGEEYMLCVLPPEDEVWI